MIFAKEADLRRVVVWSQWDRIVITMVLSCSMPFLIHAIPGVSGLELGMRWLPMFYAPLIASLCFRPHVFLVVSVCAPLINHALWGMPSRQVLPGLIFELVVFNMLLAVLRQQRQVRAWHVVVVFTAVRCVSWLTFSRSGEALAAQLSQSLTVAWPGIVALAVLAEIAGRFAQRQDR